MNKLQQAILAFREMMGNVYGNNVNNQLTAVKSMVGAQPVSPLPDTAPMKVGNFVRNEIQQTPANVVNAAKGAVRVSPIGQLYQQMEPNLGYNYEKKIPILTNLTVPYSKQLQDTGDDIRNLGQAAKFIGYASLLRPFMGNGYLKTGNQIIRNGVRRFQQPLPPPEILP